MSAHSSSRSSQAPRCRFHAKDARAHADRALRLASTEVLCRTARGLGPAGESGHDAAPRSLRRAPALYDRGETAERHVARAAVGVLPGRRIGAGDLRVSADVLLVAVDRARQHRRADTFRTAERFPSSLPRAPTSVSTPAPAVARQATDAKSDGCHRACEGANENESPAEPGRQATQDARAKNCAKKRASCSVPAAAGTVLRSKAARGSLVCWADRNRALARFDRLYW